MAFSFCCAPLLAVRFVRNRHKVPRTPGYQPLGPISRIVVAANLKLGFPLPMALGGYRPWRCQVMKKARQLGLSVAENLRQPGRQMARQPIQMQSCFANRRDDQALALLSTARSER